MTVWLEFKIFMIRLCCAGGINSYKVYKVKSYKVKIKRNSGAAMLISVVFFLFISLAIIAGLVTPTVREFKNASVNLNSKKSYFLSESGVEDAHYRLKNGITIGSSENITLDGNTVTTTISDSGYNEKTISALGNVLNFQRKNKVKLNAGTGVAFNYGIQSGLGGFVIGNATVNGNVYSNGNITGTNGTIITGSAFVAGTSGVIDDVNVGQNGTGDAWAHIVKNSTIAGNLYCQVEDNNNKSCDTSKSNPVDPVAIDMPITQEMIDKWKADAELGETINGDYTVSSTSTLGPKKITGNLAIDANLTITGTIYVVGNITTSNNAKVSLSSSYGATGGIIVMDGRATLSNNVVFSGSGNSNSFVLLITTSTCPSGCSGSNAVEILNNVGAVLVNAQSGTVHLHNNVELNEVVGNTINIENGAVINYLSGLANSNFSSGPSGGWNIKSWKEVE